MKKIFAAMVAIALVLFTVSVYAESGNQEITVNVGDQAAFFLVKVAEAKGFFEEEFAKDNIKIHTEIFAKMGPAIIEAMSTGDVDLSIVGVFPVVNANNAGNKIIILASGNYTEDGFRLVVGPEATITSVEELNGLKIAEIPTTLKKDGRSRPPHLRSMRDGWRHLKFLLMYSPNWLFLYPGLFFLIAGLIGTVVLLSGRHVLFNVSFSINTLLYFAFFIALGFNIISMFLIVKLYAYNHGFLPKKDIDWNKRLKEDRFIFLGLLAVIAGIVLSIVAVSSWKTTGFGELDPEVTMRLTIPAVILIVVGIQSQLSGFIMSIIKVKSNGN